MDNRIKMLKTTIKGRQGGRAGCGVFVSTALVLQSYRDVKLAELIKLKIQIIHKLLLEPRLRFDRKYVFAWIGTLNIKISRS